MHRGKKERSPGPCFFGPGGRGGDTAPSERILPAPLLVLAGNLSGKVL